MWCLGFSGLEGLGFSGFYGLAYGFEKKHAGEGSLRGLKIRGRGGGGLEGAQPPPPVCKHNAHMIGFKNPHLCLKQACKGHLIYDILQIAFCILYVVSSYVVYCTLYVVYCILYVVLYIIY